MTQMNKKAVVLPSFAHTVAGRRKWTGGEVNSEYLYSAISASLIKGRALYGASSSRDPSQANQRIYPKVIAVITLCGSISGNSVLPLLTSLGPGRSQCGIIRGHLHW